MDNYSQITVRSNGLLYGYITRNSPGKWEVSPNQPDISFKWIDEPLEHIEGTMGGTYMVTLDQNGIGSFMVTVLGQVNGYDAVSASAFLDPYFSIDSSYLASHPGAALELYAGIGNVQAAVPESGTVALMGMGLIAIFAKRARRSIGVAVVQ